MISGKHIPNVATISLVVMAAAVTVLSGMFLTKYLNYDSYNKQDFIDPATYQAVFLTNDQIYFGYLKNISPNYLLLSDVFYVKVNEEGAGQLIKLGVVEPHGPRNQMIINRDQLLFWENMKPDSQVVKSIRTLQLKQK